MTFKHETHDYKTSSARVAVTVVLVTVKLRESLAKTQAIRLYQVLMWVGRYVMILGTHIFCQKTTGCGC